MPQNLLHSSSKAAILKRVSALSTEAQARWGIMNAQEMLCHTADQLRVALGEIPAPVTGNFFMRTIGKWGVVAGIPIPKGSPTMAEVDPKRTGTQPTELEADRASLVSCIETFTARVETEPFSPHPLFGKMSRNQWGKLAYIHLDYHLKQFGG